MNYGYLTREENERIVSRVSKTSNFFERMRGLLGTARLETDEGLLITPCSSVHTFGMRYPIDLVFLDEDWIIVKTVKALAPWRMAAAKNSNMVLELATTVLEQRQLSIGQQLEWHDESK